VAPPASVSTKAILKVSLQGSVPAGTSVGTVDFTVNLPAGITAKADAATGETQTGVVVASGNALGSTIVAKYTPATASQAGSIRGGLINTTGFAPGEFVTLNLDIGGAVPGVSNFSTSGLIVTDVNGVTVSGLSAALALQTL
jgi:hypothetical protein